MKKIYYSIILLISGCVSKQDTPSISHFSKDFLTNIIRDSAPASFQKTVSFNDSTESKLIILDSIGLKKELETFYELDLNTPEFSKIFQKEKFILTNNSYKIVYELVEGAKHNIKSVTEVYEDKKLVKIKGTISHNTPIFFSNEKIELSIKDNILKSYAINVQQGLIAQDTNYYKVTSILK